MRRLLLHLLVALSLTIGAGCVSLAYDLSSVPLPISAQPPEPGATKAEPFTIEATNVLWVHGLFGRKTPDVSQLLRERSRGYDRIEGFRVQQKSKFSHWLVTHLSLSLIRMRTVVIEGQLVSDNRR